MKKRLGWKRKKAGAFQPRITLEHTGYSGDADKQWCLQFLSSNGRTASCGLSGLASTHTLAQAMNEAFDFLRRIGCEPVCAQLGREERRDAER